VDGPLYDPETGGYQMTRIESGSQHLDGDQALAYARARYGSSDYARMGRQRCILAAMARDADPLRLLRGLPDLLTVIEAKMSTDLPVELLPELIRLAPRVDPVSVSVIGLDSKWGVGRTVDGAVIPDVERIRSTIVTVIEDPGSAETFGAATAEAACG
jgi:anionic cell wall polymer biosynthesis LytR-Cps2A-Psr (LCP) family protein